MAGLSIILVALLVGGVVYAVSLRRGERSIETEASPEDEARHRFWSLARPVDSPARQLGLAGDAIGDEDSHVYVPVLASPAMRWRTRLSGVVGLLALVLIGATAVAIAIYQAGHLVNQMVQGFLGK